MLPFKTFGQNIVTAINNKLVIVHRSEKVSRILDIPELPPENAVKAKTSDIIKEDQKAVTSMCVSLDGNLLALTANTKQLIIYDNNFAILKQLMLSRVASKVRFIASSNDIIVADKTGDVYLFKSQNNYEEKAVLKLGHLSMLLDVLVTPCMKYVITCDRDEKIRVSHYPNSYNIQTYCLGHAEFVTNIELFEDVLVSASGDGTIRLWNYMTGLQLDVVDTNKYVKDTSIQEKLSAELDKDNIEIKALPITNMQICVTENECYVIVSLLNWHELLVFRHVDHKLTHVQSLDVKMNILAFYCNDMLLVLCAEKFCSYKLQNNQFVELNVGMNDLFHLYDNLLECNSITKDNMFVLYKRKFDNVQEYLERKKQRLEIS